MPHSSLPHSSLMAFMVKLSEVVGLCEKATLRNPLFFVLAISFIAFILSIFLFCPHQLYHPSPHPYVSLLNKMVNSKHSKLTTEKLVIIVLRWHNTWLSHCLMILECYYFKGSRKNSECCMCCLLVTLNKIIPE